MTLLLTYLFLSALTFGLVTSLYLGLKVIKII